MEDRRPPWRKGDKVMFATFDSEFTRESELDGYTGTVVSEEADRHGYVEVKPDPPGYDTISIDEYALMEPR